MAYIMTEAALAARRTAARARWTAMTPEERSAFGRKMAAARWRKRADGAPPEPAAPPADDFTGEAQIRDLARRLIEAAAKHGWSLEVHEGRLRAVRTVTLVIEP